MQLCAMKPRLLNCKQRCCHFPILTLSFPLIHVTCVFHWQVFKQGELQDSAEYDGDLNPKSMLVFQTEALPSRILRMFSFCSEKLVKSLLPSDLITQVKVGLRFDWRLARKFLCVIFLEQEQKSFFVEKRAARETPQGSPVLQSERVFFVISCARPPTQRAN